MKDRIILPDGSRAFTLIELMIVIAILLILAAAGVGSWNDAVARAKVARVQAEFRSFSTAIEAYRVDRGTEPRMRHVSFYGDPNVDSIDGIAVKGILSQCLSTPVAYLSKVSYFDPFTVGLNSVPLDEQFYTYQVIPEYILKEKGSAFWPEALRFYGRWRLMSAGPDKYFDHNFINSAQLPYNPTNGTNSLGNIIYSENHKDNPMPPVPQLLGST